MSDWLRTRPRIEAAAVVLFGVLQVRTQALVTLVAAPVMPLISLIRSLAPLGCVCVCVCVCVCMCVCMCACVRVCVWCVRVACSGLGGNSPAAHHPWRHQARKRVHGCRCRWEWGSYPKDWRLGCMQAKSWLHQKVLADAPIKHDFCFSPFRRTGSAGWSPNHS